MSGAGPGTTPGAPDDRDALPADPWTLAARWLPADDDPDRPQMILSTIGADGGPDARTLLLTTAGPEGFTFHTDARSRKAAQIAAHPAVALTVLWPGFTRQLVVLGRAEIAPPEQIAAAYRGRNAYLQQLAWQNTEEFAQLPSAEREARWAACAAEHPDGFEQPATWTGYLVRPHRLTFWFGGPQTASLRAEYTAGPDGWTVTRLPG